MELSGVGTFAILTCTHWDFVRWCQSSMNCICTIHYEYNYTVMDSLTRKRVRLWREGFTIAFFFCQFQGGEFRTCTSQPQTWLTPMETEPLIFVSGNGPGTVAFAGAKFGWEHQSQGLYGDRHIDMYWHVQWISMIYSDDVCKSVTCSSSSQRIDVEPSKSDMRTDLRFTFHGCTSAIEA